MDLQCFQGINAVSFDPAGLTSSWQPLNGPGGFSDSIKIMKIYNGGSVGIDISYDGVNKHDYFPPGGALIIDFQANHDSAPTYGTGTLNGRKGQIIYGRTSTSSTHLQIAGYK